MKEQRLRRSHVRKALSRRPRAAFVPLAQLIGGTAACAMWAALALPGMHLLPGLGGGADANVSISLQSALLGIDEHGAVSTATLSPELLRVRRNALRASLAIPLDARLQLLGQSQARNAASATTDTPPAPPAPPSPASLSPSDVVSAPLEAAASTPVTPVVTTQVPRPHKAPVTTPVTPPVVAPPATTPQLLTQAIVFTSTPPADAVVGGSAYSISAVAGSGLPVVFTADAASSGTCMVAGTLVLPLGPGTCTVDANQPGNSAYKAARQVQQSFTIRSAIRLYSLQSISFLSNPPATAVVGAGPYLLNAAASSGLPVSYSTSPGSSDVCQLANGALWFIGSGTCRVFADQSGDAVYLSAPQAQQVIPVALVPQSITFTSAPPAHAGVGDPPYIVSATTNSGLAVVFSADPSSAAVCTVVGASVIPVGAGTCVVDASQFGTTAYAAAHAQQSFTVGAAAPSQSVQSIQFTSLPPGSGQVGGTPYALAATASSGLPVTFAATPASSSVCAVSGGSVTFDAAGTCTITADQAGDASYLPASQVQQSFPVTLVPQAISFSSAPPAAALAGDPAYTVSATSSSGLGVTFSLSAGSTGVCSISGSSVSLIGPGTCTIDADQAGNATYQPAAQVQQSFTVAAPSLSVQSISFLSAAPVGASINGAAYSVSASASSGLPVSFTVDATSAGVCTISGTTVSFAGTGTCTIDANQVGNASYQAAPQVQQSFAVGRHAQTISFTSAPPVGAVVGGTAPIAAAATSGLPVALAGDASSGAVCTVSGTTVSFEGAGTCTLDADQGGDATYLAAPQAQQSFTVSVPSASSQSISFTSTAPAGAAVGGTYDVSAAASSGLAVAFAIDAASAGACTISGTTVSLAGTGTCTIDATQPGNGSYQPAAQVQQSFSVGLTTQAISFTSVPPSGALAGDPAYSVSATATSGLPVAFSADPASTGICTVSGSTVSLIGSGTCMIDANQSGNGTYSGAAQVQQSFGIGVPSTPSSQTISFTSTAPSGAVVGGAAYTVAAGASSGLPVTFSATPASAGVCTVSGSTVSPVGAGTCTIDADQAGDANYAAATQVQQSFVVSLRSQTISFTSAPPGGATVGGATYSVGATSTSALAVALSIDAASTSVCALSGSTVSFTGAGTCTLDANQAGNAAYLPAAQAQQSFTVTAASASPQSISFTSTPPASGTVGGATYAVSAVASSGLSVNFAIDASSTGVCTISGATVSFTSTGTCKVDANQAGNASYQAAPQAQQAIAVGLASQTISFTSTPPAAATVGGATYSISASASSGLAVAFTRSSGSATVCSLSGATVSFTGAGTCTILANQPGNGTYAAAPQVQQSLTVSTPAPSKSNQTITFTSTAPSSAVVGGTTYTVSATASSGLAVALAVAPASSGICAISGSTVSFGGAGTCTINANQAGNASYNAAPQVQQSFAVNLRSQTIAFSSHVPASAVVGGSTYTVAASASSGLSVAFSVEAGGAAVCAISGQTVTMTGAGTCIIDANQAGNATYAAATQVQQSFAVARGSQTIAFTSTPPNADKHDPPYTVTAAATSGLAVVFTVDPSSAGVCSVSGSTVSFEGRGSCIIYANEPGNANWLPAPQVQQVIDVKNHTPG